jgi:hypothetical protein
VGTRHTSESWYPESWNFLDAGFHRHDDKKTNDFLNELLRQDAGG